MEKILRVICLMICLLIIYVSGKCQVKHEPETTTTPRLEIEILTVRKVG